MRWGPDPQVHVSYTSRDTRVNRVERTLLRVSISLLALQVYWYKELQHCNLVQGSIGCNENRIPAKRTGFPVMKAGFFL